MVAAPITDGPLNEGFKRRFAKKFSRHMDIHECSPIKVQEENSQPDHAAAFV